MNPILVHKFPYLFRLYHNGTERSQYGLNRVKYGIMMSKCVFVQLCIFKLVMQCWRDMSVNMAEK